MSKILKALIPVRSGSKRVANKNIRPFAGSNLLEVKIKQLQRIKELDGIVVNSNDDEMLAIARDLGCEAVKRDEYYAGDNVTNEMYKNIAENCKSDIIMYTNVTSPMIEDATISKLIQCYHDNCAEYDSVNTAHYLKEFMWLDGKPMNYELDKTPKSQDLPNIMALNFAINLIDRRRLIDISHYVGKKPYLYVIDRVEAIDIDDMIDFEFAEFMYKKLRLGE
ncbi:MAG: acylneuraminate cytidylyltransferase family protein [Candidatus Gastranaerophilales bacterium]|nr:acylneuraminate cytidylyltransferase family protein [Candidatus Gastranaerophilales bacterium]